MMPNLASAALSTLLAGLFAGLMIHGQGGGAPPDLASGPAAEEATPPPQGVELPPTRLATTDLPPPPERPSLVAAAPAEPPAEPLADPIEPALDPGPGPAAAEAPQPAPAAEEPAPAASPVPAVGPLDRTARREGRVLLQLLESGQGPSIEILWPGLASERERLAARLEDCLGMQLALVDPAGGLLLLASRDGPRAFDGDRLSGFVRAPTGGLTEREQAAERAVRLLHPGPDLVAVRLFPRDTDAALLGGLARLLGQQYRRASDISARYRLDRGGVSVVDIDADGQRVPGEVVLPVRASCRRAS